MQYFFLLFLIYIRKRNRGKKALESNLQIQGEKHRDSIFDEVKSSVVKLFLLHTGQYILQLLAAILVRKIERRKRSECTTN